MLKKKSVHCSWDIYREKLATKFSKVLWWAYWVGYLRNFHSFFVIIFFLNFNFFQLLQSVLLKNKKNIPKKDAVQLKISSQCKRQKKILKKRERKTKNAKKSNKDNKYIFIFTFLYSKTYIMNLGKLFHIFTFVLQFFRVAGYRKCSSKTLTPKKISIGLVDTVLWPKLLINRLGI